MKKKSSEESQSAMKIYLSNPWGLIKTGFLVLTWIVMSIHIELVAPTMPILAANVRVHYTGMGSALASRGAGYLVANILGAVLQNIVKKYSDGLLVCAFILPAIVVFVTPFVTSLALLCVLFFIQGVGQGCTDLGGTNILLTMWGANAAAPLNTVYLGYGIGAILVNLLVRPFVTENVSPLDIANNLEINSTLGLNTTVKAKANIFVPYSVTSALCLLIAVGFVFFYVRELKGRREKLEVRQVDYAIVSTIPDVSSGSNAKEDISPYSPRVCGGGSFQYGLVFSIIFICSVFVAVGNDQTFSKFFFAYLKFDRFNISNGAASWGIILYWLSYSIGRLISAVASVFFSVTTCLTIVWCGGLCIAVAWMLFVWVVGLTGTSLFILGAATGLVFAPIIPLTFAFFNQRLNVVPLLLALVLCGSALGMITFQKIGGFVMDHNANHFPTLFAVCIFMSIFLYIISNVVSFLHQRKSSSTIPALRSKDISDEEQRMTDYLREQENI